MSLDKRWVSHRINSRVIPLEQGDSSDVQGTLPLAAQGAFSLLLFVDEASGLMTVVVVPKHSEGGKDVPALAMPLKLTAVPRRIDAGFVQAVPSY